MSQLSHCQSCQETPEEQDRVKVASRSQVKTSNNLAVHCIESLFQSFQKNRKEEGDQGLSLLDVLP